MQPGGAGVFFQFFEFLQAFFAFVFLFFRPFQASFAFFRDWPR